MEEDFPRKAFYTIGEVSRITGVKPHVLRYWESRGKIIRPGRRGSRHRQYRPADIQLIFEIKRLREEEKLPLAAMRRQLDSRKLQPFSFAFLPHSPEGRLLTLLRDLREELRGLKELLD